MHIQRTAGKYLLNTIVDDLAKTNQIEILNKSKSEGDLLHNGWLDQIDGDTYVMTVLRDPIELICSHYCHYGLTPNCVTEADYTKENLFKFIAKNPQIHNLQSKNFMITAQTYPELVLKSSMYQKVDFHSLEEKVQRINFAVTLDYIKENSIESIASKVASDLGIDPFFNKDKEVPQDEISYRAKQIYDSLNNDDKNTLTRYFEGDYYIYNRVRGKEL